MSRQDAGGGTVLLAFLAGAISGAAVALLFAPAAGEETRQFLTDKARESRERAVAAAREGREVIRRQKDQISSAIDRGRDGSFDLAGRQTKAAGERIKNFRIEHNTATRQTRLPAVTAPREIRNQKLHLIHSQRAGEWFVT